MSFILQATPSLEQYEMLVVSDQIALSPLHIEWQMYIYVPAFKINESDFVLCAKQNKIQCKYFKGEKVQLAQISF